MSQDLGGESPQGMLRNSENASALVSGVFERRECPQSSGKSVEV